MKTSLKTFAGLLSIVLVTAAPAWANETRLTGAEILTDLRGAKVVGEDWSQSFEDGGSTIYNAEGNQSSGRWDVRGDQYCSVWPPSDVWACYDMTISAASEGGFDVTWISADGARTYGHLIPKGK